MAAAAVDEGRLHVAKLELAGRKVDRHDKVGRQVLAPFGELGQRLVHHQSAKRFDQTDFLGQRNELVGSHQPVAILPAHQRLGSAQAAVGKASLWLKVQ